MTVPQRIFLVFLCAGILFHAEPSFSQAPFSTGNDFLKNCAQESADCNNYTAGMLDGMQGMAAYTKSKYDIACGGQVVTVRQMKDILVKYVRDNPETRHLHTGVLFIEALKRAFPCG